MNIIGLVKKNSGVDFHRILMPLLLMPGVDTYITNALKEEDLNGADAIFYNREVSDTVINEARRRGLKIIVDVDDYWHLDPHHIAYDGYKLHDYASKQERHIRQADIVTTTHERLAEIIRPFNKNVYVFANAIPTHEYFSIDKSESKLPRIFWQGSITHEKDLMLLKNPFKRLTKCATIIAGHTDHEVWGKMVNAFTNGLSLPGMVLPGTSPFEYYSNYAHADICVAPLVPTKFNGLKSNLKALEAAHSSLPIICSKVDPYLDLPVLYAESQKDWFKHINSLIHDKDMRIELGNTLYDFCQRNYNFDVINKNRYECFS